MNKGLEALKRIKSFNMNNSKELSFNDFRIIQNELQALDVIKTKLLVGCFSEDDNYSNYAMAIMMSGNETLKKNMMTEEEYNL